MQATVLFLVTLLMATTPAAPRFSQSIEHAGQELADASIDNLDLQEGNIHLMLARLSAATRIPIGLEVSPNDDLLFNREMKLHIQKATVRDEGNRCLTRLGVKAKLRGQ